MIIRMDGCIMFSLVWPTNVIRTEFDVVLFVYAKMAALFTTVLSNRVGRVSVTVRFRVSMK